MRNLLRAMIVLFIATSPAAAQVIPSIPYNLTNGSLADATQVMGNFNTIVTDVNANAATAGINSNITSLTGLSTPLAPSQGGTTVYTGGTSAGAANAQTLTTVVPGNFTLTIGNLVTFTAGFTNTAPMTLSVNGTSAKAVTKPAATGVAAFTGGEVIAGASYLAGYDGVEYVLLNPTLGYDGTNFALASSGNIAFGTAPVLPSTTTATTQSPGDNSTKLATTAYVATASGALHGGLLNVQSLTASSGTYTKTTNTASQIVACWGGGGGGGSGSPGAGGTTTFDILNATGGGAASATPASGGVGSGGNILNAQGGGGEQGTGTAFTIGGVAAGGGGGGGGGGTTGQNGGFPGGGASGSANTASGAGGGFVEHYYATAVTSISYTIGAGGTAGTSGKIGGAGACIVYEYR